MNGAAERPECVEDWTKEHVRHWLLCDLKISQENADKLYNEDVTGASLVCFQKKDFLDLGLTHGPVVQIINNVKSLQKSSGKPRREKPSVSGKDIFRDNNGEQEQSVTNTLMACSAEPSPSFSGAMHMTVDVKPSTVGCLTRPFDKESTSHSYKKNDILPPETGPSNLLDPVHEYKLLCKTQNAPESEVLSKFSKEVMRFAAACMNRRTNGTIHFGVGDAPEYAHGQVIGIRVPSPQKYIDALDQDVQNYFVKNTNIARMCIRPPKFVQVLDPENAASDLSVIEVDVVPNFSETQETFFYISLKSQDKQGKKCTEECLFVRQGARSINMLRNPRDLQYVMHDVKSWASARKSIEGNDCQQPRQSNQGQRLKQLISHGKDTLSDSFHSIVVTNKCPSSQLENLQFLKEINLFAVLEFDPESEFNGSCSFFRKDRVANIHYPRMYNTSDSLPTIIAKLNLFKQPSWVFCSGRTNEEREDERPLDSKDWFKKRAGEVQDLVKFICNPEVLQTKTIQVIFLLHSNVERISSPILETFCMIYQKLGGVENMICICRDPSVFNMWRDLVKTRCEIDISSNCIYELNLNEVNSTIVKMKGPQTISASRYLPSFGSSSVLLAKKDEEQMTVLEILCENECENSEIESSTSFSEFKNKTEENFYRGGKVTWWNFYLSEKPGSLPFIKRDKFEELYDLITPQEGYKTPCVIINLFHHPGCGGTTLAMHVLWNLRRKFRCAVLKNNKAQNIEIAAQVIKLLTYAKGEQTSYTPVLLLVDDFEDVLDLHRCLLLNLHEIRDGDRLMFIILNCKRSQFPDNCTRNSRLYSVSMINKLSPKEQGFFKQKLEDLENVYENPETFYAFMIMTENFSEEYIEDLVRNSLEGLDISSKVGQLLSFLALLNTFVNASSMSLSLCEEFMGIKNALWGQETLEEKMNPYFTLLICFSIEEYGTYQAVRFLHQMIADKCLKELARTQHLKLSEIASNLLHCDLLYKSAMGRDILIQNVLSMLITRQQTEVGDDKMTLFSPLIEEIQTKEGMAQLTEVLIEATKRFEKNATVPQALARHFYLREKDFESALKWANDAKQKMYNSYIADTIGQVHRSHLKYEIELAEKQHKMLEPKDLEMYLTLASKASIAFQDSQKLADKDESFESSEQRIKRRQTTYNTSGYVGEIDVGILTFNVLQNVPFFNKRNEINRQKMLNFLKNALPVSDFHESKENEGFVTVLKNNERFLLELKSRVKHCFIFLENSFTYLKPRSIETDSAEDRNKRKVSKYFKEYVNIFCSTGEERESERTNQPKLSLLQQIEDAWHYLERKHADTFAGLLQCLNVNAHEMEKIFEKYEFILEQSARITPKTRMNFILANIVLHCIKPNSKVLKKNEVLAKLLNEILQEEGTLSNQTELYFLAILLLWPRHGSTQEEITTSKNICIYISSIKKAFHQKFSRMFFSKSAITHFFLGKSRGLKRIVHRGKLEQSIRKEQQIGSHHLWQSGGIWREPNVQELLLRVKGITENEVIYVHYHGNLKIPVRPVYLGHFRSGCSAEKVSFYLGFSMDGPVAYDIKYSNDE